MPHTDDDAEHLHDYHAMHGFHDLDQEYLSDSAIAIPVRPGQGQARPGRSSKDKSDAPILRRPRKDQGHNMIVVSTHKCVWCAQPRLDAARFRKQRRKNIARSQRDEEDQIRLFSCSVTDNVVARGSQRAGVGGKLLHLPPSALHNARH
eukprot:2834328-Rhodomonas_salina.1